MDWSVIIYTDDDGCKPVLFKYYTGTFREALEQALAECPVPESDIRNIYIEVD